MTIMNEMMEIWRCEGCGMHHLKPITVCFRCTPREHAKQVEGFKQEAAEARPVAIDFYCDGMLAVTADGVFIHVRDAGTFMRTQQHANVDKLVCKVGELETENAKLHEENSRMRHRLEGK